MTISELARASKLTEGAIRGLERGAIRGPSVFAALRLARALEVSVAYLAFGKDDPEEQVLRSHEARIVELERRVSEIDARGHRESTSEDQGGGDRPRTAPE
jgi:transcriptional regulator with XRE-family HTH domain